MTSSTFPNVVAKLRFLAKILPSEKLDITAMSLRSNNTYTRLYRTYRTYVLQDDKACRNAALDFIDSTFNNAFTIQATFTNTEVYKNTILVCSIQEALNGIVNLKQTYAEDKMFLARLETTIEIYTKQLEQLTRIDSC